MPYPEKRSSATSLLGQHDHNARAQPKVGQREPQISCFLAAGLPRRLRTSSCRTCSCRVLGARGPVVVEAAAVLGLVRAQWVLCISTSHSLISLSLSLSLPPPPHYLLACTRPSCSRYSSSSLPPHSLHLSRRFSNIPSRRLPPLFTLSLPPLPALSLFSPSLYLTHSFAGSHSLSLPLPPAPLQPPSSPAYRTSSSPPPVPAPVPLLSTLQPPFAPPSPPPPSHSDLVRPSPDGPVRAGRAPVPDGGDAEVEFSRPIT
jgi:hypothetical protein